MGALDGVAEWPVEQAAAGVAGPDGPLATAGPTDRELPLASVTKLLTATAVLVAVEEEAIGLDQAAGPKGSTVRHLLAHASGLDPDRPEPVAPPGTRRIYSNAGFEVLAGVVAERSGMAFAEYLQEAVLSPLGLKATRLEGSPAAGASSTVDDLLRFAGELLAPTLLAPETLEAATTVAFPGLDGVLPGFGRQQPNDWGLGFEIRDDKHPHWTGAGSSPATFGHFGRRAGILWVDPEARLACVALTDGQFGDWAMEAWPRLADEVLAELGP